MGYAGLVLLIAVGLGIVLTGLPAAIVLIGAASAGAAFGVVSGAVPFALLSALPGRLVNLLENDLLQALPLYVLMGLLLDRLPVAEALYKTILSILPRGPAAQLVSGMSLGALLGPMNGSVGASALGLSRVVAPRLAAHGVPEPTRAALVAVASTLGVVIPPSLVLILLGDAMLGAHTIAVTATGRSDRVINTQDVFHGALAPAGLFLLLCLAVAWLAGRRLPVAAAAADEKPTTGQVLLAIVSVAAVVAIGIVFRFGDALLGWRPISDGALAATRACDGPLYNRYGDGGTLIWFLPEKPVFVDGRQDPYPLPFLLEAVALEARQKSYRYLFDQWRLRCAFLPADSGTAADLMTDGWAVRFKDDKWQVLAAPATRAAPAAPAAPQPL